MQRKLAPYQSLEKALKILLLFESQNREVGTVEISEMVGLHRSTVSRILKVFVTFQFLQQNPQTKKFSLGPSNINLANSLKQTLRTDLVQIAKPYVDELRDRLLETVIIEIPKGKYWVMAYVAEGPGPFRLVAEIGNRIPFHVASGAKAYLAFSSPEMQNEFLTEQLRPVTKNSVTDPNELRRQFDEIKQKGFSFDQGELDDGINAVGAPIFNHENGPVASIVIAGTPQRVTGTNNSPIVIALKETATKISKRLCYQNRSVTGNT